MTNEEKREIAENASCLYQAAILLSKGDSADALSAMTAALGCAIVAVSKEGRADAVLDIVIEMLHEGQTRHFERRRAS